MKIVGRPQIDVEAVLVLNEHEIGALDALFGYNVEAFLETFYEQMGRAYLEPHEAGLRSLHANREGLSTVLEKLREARKVFNGEAKAVRS